LAKHLEVFDKTFRSLLENIQEFPGLTSMFLGSIQKFIGLTLAFIGLIWVRNWRKSFGN